MSCFERASLLRLFYCREMVGVKRYLLTAVVRQSE